MSWKEAFLALIKEIDNPKLLDIARELQACAEQWETEVTLEMRKIWTPKVEKE